MNWCFKYSQQLMKTSLAPTLSILTAIFPEEPGLVIFIEAKADGRDDDKWSCQTCKAPVKCHHQQNNTRLFTALPVVQPTMSKH